MRKTSLNKNIIFSEKSVILCQSICLKRVKTKAGRIRPFYIYTFTLSVSYFNFNVVRQCRRVNASIVETAKISCISNTGHFERSLVLIFKTLSKINENRNVFCLF